MQQKRLQQIISISMVFAIEILWTYIWLYTDIVRKYIQNTVNYDLCYYVSSIMLALITFILSYNIIIKCKINLPARSNKGSQLMEHVFEGVSYCVLGFAFVSIFIYEKYTVDFGSFYNPWHSSRTTEVLLLIIIIFMAIQLRVWKNELFANVYFEKNKPYVWYGLLILIVTWSNWLPNWFTSQYNMWHTHAYFNSIYRVLHLQPYNSINEGVYGHYGILIAPFVKLLGGDIYAAAIILALLAGISVLSLFYVLDNLVDKVWLKILSSVGVTTAFVAVSTNVYYQNYPHRTIFVGIVLAYIVWQNKHQKKGLGNFLIGCILCSLAMVWNIETGIGCTFAYIGSKIVAILQMNIFDNLKKTCFQIVGQVICIPTITIFAWIFVGCYNIVVSKSFITFKEFLYPIVGNEYVDTLSVSLGTMPSGWMAVLFIFLVVIAIVVSRTILCRNPIQDWKGVCITAGTIEVAIQMTYFVNRSVYGNLYIVLPITAILMAYLVDFFGQHKIWNENCLGNGVLRAFSVFTSSMLILLFVMTLSKYFYIENEKNNNRNMESVNELAKKIEELVPKDTLAIGCGIPEIYSYLGWDTGYYGIDMSDYACSSEKCKKYTIEMVKNSDLIFIDSQSLASIFQYSNEPIETFNNTHYEKARVETVGSTYILYCKFSEDIGSTWDKTVKAANVYDDGFIGIEGDIWIRTGDTGILNINLYCPFELTGEEGYKIYINGSEMVSAKAENGEMLQNISTNLVNQVVALHIETNFTKKPDNGDLRDLSLKITNVEAE